MIEEYKKAYAEIIDNVDCKWFNRNVNKIMLIQEAIDTLEQHQRYINNEPYTVDELQNMMDIPVWYKDDRKWLIIYNITWNLNYPKHERIIMKDIEGIEYTFYFTDINNRFYPREVTE